MTDEARNVKVKVTASWIIDMPVSQVLYEDGGYDEIHEQITDDMSDEEIARLAVQYDMESQPEEIIDPSNMEDYSIIVIK